MRMTFKVLMVGAALAASAVGAQDIKAPDEILTARHGYMLSLAMNIAPLASMAKGQTPYDPAVAKVAAANLANLSALDTGYLWVQGTEAGTLADSSALPAAFTDVDVRTQKLAALKTAADALQVAAGTDLESLKSAMGAMGGAYGDCHKAFRQP